MYALRTAAGTFIVLCPVVKRTKVKGLHFVAADELAKAFACLAKSPETGAAVVAITVNLIVDFRQEEEFMKCQLDNFTIKIVPIQFDQKAETPEAQWREHVVQTFTEGSLNATVNKEKSIDPDGLAILTTEASLYDPKVFDAIRKSADNPDHQIAVKITNLQSRKAGY